MPAQVYLTPTFPQHVCCAWIWPCEACILHLAGFNWCKAPSHECWLTSVMNKLAVVSQYNIIVVIAVAYAAMHVYVTPAVCRATDTETCVYCCCLTDHCSKGSDDSWLEICSVFQGSCTSVSNFKLGSRSFHQLSCKFCNDMHTWQMQDNQWISMGLLQTYFDLHPRSVWW